MQSIRNQNEEWISSKWLEMSSLDDQTEAINYTGNRSGLNDPCFEVRGLHNEWDYENHCYGTKNKKESKKK